jgi:hypothetical protein
MTFSTRCLITLHSSTRSPPAQPPLRQRSIIKPSSISPIHTPVEEKDPPSVCISGRRLSMAFSRNLRSPGVGLLHRGERPIGHWDRRPGLSPMQDQRVSLALELESFKAHHHHGMGFAADEEDITDHRRSQAGLDPGVAMMDDVGLPPCPVQRLLERRCGRFNRVHQVVRHIEDRVEKAKRSRRWEKDFNEHGPRSFRHRRLAKSSASPQGLPTILLRGGPMRRRAHLRG